MGRSHSPTSQLSHLGQITSSLWTSDSSFVKSRVATPALQGRHMDPEDRLRWCWLAGHLPKSRLWKGLEHCVPVPPSWTEKEREREVKGLVLGITAVHSQIWHGVYHCIIQLHSTSINRAHVCIPHTHTLTHQFFYHKDQRKWKQQRHKGTLCLHKLEALVLLI